jgi:four helix bundle protein
MKGEGEKFDFEKFNLYQRATNFANEVYNVTKKFPKSEQFGLCAQLRRASLSIPLNIAEGFGKYHKNEKIQYYRTARASIHECIPGLSISLKQNFISQKIHEEMYNECYELSRMISGLINSIEKRYLHTSSERSERPHTSPPLQNTK